MKYVYILKAGADHYKVGIAKNVTKRVANIQTSNAYKIYVVAVRLCLDANKVEHTIHEKLAAMATGGGGEWFKLTPEQVIKVCIYLNMEQELDVYDNASLNVSLAEMNQKLSLLVKSEAVAISNPQVQVHNNVVAANIVDEVAKKTQKEREEEEMYTKALRVVIEANQASTSMLQRKLGIGYGRASRIIDELEKNEVISEQDGPHPRQIIYKPVLAARQGMKATIDTY